MLEYQYLARETFWMLKMLHSLIELHSAEKILMIYRNNVDVRNTAQKTRSYNWNFKHNLQYINIYVYIYIYIYLFVCLFAFSCFTKLLKFTCRTVKRYLHISYIQLFGYFCKHNIMHITYLNIQKIKIYSLTTLVSITIIW